MSKCQGCGVELQSTDESNLGYIVKGNLCTRCFRIQNYNELTKTAKPKDSFTSILREINKKKDLVVLVIDLFNIENSIEMINKYISNDVILVLTKKDLLLEKIEEKKLLDYIDIKCVSKMIVSSKNNYNLDLLMENIYRHKRTKNVYFVGMTNVGKSNLINKIIYNYSSLSRSVTTSNMPSTTLDLIKIKIKEDLILIDTPGIIDEGSIINYVDLKTIKKIMPTKPIKPTTYQVKDKQFFLIDDIFRFDVEQNNITFFMSDKLIIKRMFKENNLVDSFIKHIFEVDNKTDIVITGLGFIKVNNRGKIILYTLKGVEVYTRKSLI